MKTSNKGLVELVGHEGVCLSKYKDSVGVWTIGIGATKSEIPDLASWPLSKKITMQEAFDLLSKGIVKYENALNRALKAPVSQTQFDALVSWMYNVGTGYASKATVIKLLNNGVKGNALFDALMMYRKPPEITERRRKEAKLIASGVYSNGGKALLFPVSSKGYPMYKAGTTVNVWEYINNTSDQVPNTREVGFEEEKMFEEKPSLIKTILNVFTGGQL